MAKKIPLQQITSPRYLSAFVFDQAGPETAGSTIDKQKMEVYTGWITIDVGSSNLGHEEIVCFLPTQNQNVWNYRNVSPTGNVHSSGMDVAVTVAPSQIRTSEGFGGIAAVDDASVTLERQPQLAAKGSQDIPN